MENINLVDYTGSIFSQSFFTLVPGDTDRYAQGSTVEVRVEGTVAGTATIIKSVPVQWAAVNDAQTYLATGKPVNHWRSIFMRQYGKGADVVPLVSLILNWQEYDSEVFRALMALRFDRIKGIRPHERQLTLFNYTPTV